MLYYKEDKDNLRVRVKVLVDTRYPTQDPPPISIIIPVFNVSNWVSECLRSVQANASEVNLELIIIDDGSSDDSLAKVLAILAIGDWPPVLLLSQPNRGLSEVRNLGVTLARGDLIGFLDSDDLMKPGTLRRMLDLGVAAEADVVLGRTEVFDSASRKVSPFMDSAFWDDLLKSAGSMVTDAGQSPRLLALEPNANYRLIRRAFYLEQQLVYPEGLFFEDAPVHFRMLLRARRIALLNEVYYRYRVNRPGKITEDKSQRRFDVLQVLALAVEELKADGATAEQAGAALRVLFRLAWGCGIMTLPEHRQAFFVSACDLLGSQIPCSWMDAYLKQHRLDPRHYLLGLLLMGEETSILLDVADKKMPLTAIMAFLLRTGWVSLGRVAGARLRA